MSSGSLSSSEDVHIKQLESPSNRAKPAQATTWKTGKLYLIKNHLEVYEFQNFKFMLV